MKKEQDSGIAGATAVGVTADARAGLVIPCLYGLMPTTGWRVRFENTARVSSVAGSIWNCCEPSPAQFKFLEQFEPVSSLVLLHWSCMWR